MNSVARLSRRRVLRGMMGGTVVTLGLPFLDCFLDANGAALAATGTQLPVCFGTWFYGCGFNPGRWEPRTVGPNYEFGIELQPLSPFKSKINVYSQMTALLDGRPPGAHSVGPAVIVQGTAPPTLEHPMNPEPSIDALIADVIGSRTRFRSLEVSCTGQPQSSHSKRTGSATNPSEVSPLALYTRVFGADFKDPNAADFVPDPAVMVRQKRALGGGRADEGPHESTRRGRPGTSRPISHLVARTRTTARPAAAKAHASRCVLDAGKAGQDPGRLRSGVR